jgi:quinol-cytochrome oxidoreductase complex cytochrome b subunit
MIGAMAIFLVKKDMDSSLPQVTYFRPLQEFSFFFFLLCFLFLKNLGGLVIEEPFSTTTQYFAGMYFFYLKFILSFISNFEDSFYISKTLVFVESKDVI